MHVHLLPYLIPIRRNSVVLLEVRALAVNYLRSPLARAIPLLFLASFVRPYPRCSCTCPLISRLYFRGSLYSHTFFCTLQPRNLFKNPVSLERGSSLPLSPCYMPCIRPWLLERGSQLIIHAWFLRVITIHQVCHSRRFFVHETLMVRSRTFQL